MSPRLVRTLSRVLPLLLAPLAVWVAPEAGATAKPSCSWTRRIVIPTTHLEQDRFALALHKFCADLRTSRFDPGNVTDLPPASLAPVRAAEQFDVDALVAAVSSLGGDKPRAGDALASLSALKKTCEAIALRRLDGQDLKNLRAFHEHTPEVLFVMDQLALNQTTLRGVFTGTGGLKSGAEDAVAAPWQALEENLVKGLTTFVMDRAKAESILYLSQQLQEALCKADAPPYFQNLCVALGDLDTKLQLAAMGAYLQAAARHDLENLPDVLLQQAACAQPGNVPQVTAARLGLAFYREAQTSRHPLDIARNLQHVRLDCAGGACADLMEALQVGSQLMEALQRQSGWESLPLTAPDDVRWRHYAIGALLSFEKLRNLQFKDEEVAPALNILDGSLHEVVAISRAIQQLRDESRNFDALDLAIQVSRSVSVLVQLGIEGGQRWAGMTPDQTKPLLVAMDVADFGERAMDDLRPGPLALALSELLVNLKTHVPELQMPPEVTRGMPFVVELANAESSDQVARAIETAAAPVGSYRSKYERFTVSLNALLGLSGGMEWLDDGSTATDSPFFGLIAPVGVHAAGPLSDNVHLGLMASVLDVGNLAAFRLKNEIRAGSTTTSVEGTPRPSFAQVFGPGFYGTLGLGLGTTRRSPFVMGAGVSLVPGGRQVSLTTRPAGATEPVTTTSSRTAVRASLFLAVDVTLLPF